MKILYLSQARLPSNRANSIHVVKMSSAMAQQGHEITVSGYKGSFDDIYDYYGVAPGFETYLTPYPEKVGESVALAISVLIKWLAQWHWAGLDFVYSRSAICLFFVQRFVRQSGLELHSAPRTRWHAYMERRIFRNSRFKLAVFITHELKHWYLSHYPELGQKKVLVLPDAASPIDASLRAPDTFRQVDRLQAGYLGHLYPGKGGEMLVALSRKLPDIDFHAIGGRREDINRLERLSPGKNLRFHGHVSHAEAQSFLLGFDIALAPFSESVSLANTDADIGRWMSPLKIFEYMAAAKPIIASDLPVLREVLKPEENALLAKPDDVEDWVRTIIRLVKSPDLKTRISNRALEDFQTKYTWHSRAEKLIDAIKNQNH